MNISELDIHNAYQATVQESARITPETADEVRHIVLNIVDRGFSCVEGQSIAVLSPGPHPFGNRRHLRLYSIASACRDGTGSELAICVRRCFYVDEVSGERYPGVSSNYLCDARPGDAITVAGPYGSPFKIPEDDTCNLLMIGTGTGVAPFRALIKRIFEEHAGWTGKLRLFYGARVGTELLYMNDIRSDIAEYYTEGTFRAFAALSPRPALDPEPAIERTLEENAEEVWQLIQDPKTYTYLAGLAKTAEQLDKAMVKIAGSSALWRWRKEEMMSQGRWFEILYD